MFNAPLALNHSTASSALLFMLALAKRLFEQDRTTRLGRWDRQAEVVGTEIFGRTLGIVGLGHSGRELGGWRLRLRCGSLRTRRAPKPSKRTLSVSV